MSDAEKKDFLTQEYITNNKSFKIIAESIGSYPNKLRRDAIKLGIMIRNKSEAQTNAISSGRHKHPTKGQNRTEETKSKIGRSVMLQWQTLSEEELTLRKNKARENWNNMDDNLKADILSKANKAVRKSSKEGSKLEKFLLNALISDGYKVDFHKEHMLSNTKLQLDIFLPKLDIAIEVDGPSHFDNIWGDKALIRNTQYDQKKEGLLSGKGIKLIRIKQIGDFSKSRALELYNKLKLILINKPSSSQILEY